MKKRLALLLVLTSLFCGVAVASAGNLSLIEKRLIELDKLNKQAIEQVGELPRNGSAEIEAKVSPGETSSESTPGSTGKRFDFSKKTVLAIDEKVPFTVQISASRSQQQCYRVAAMLRRTGYPAFTSSLKLKDQGLWHRIFIGSFATMEEAEKTRQSLEQDEIADSLIRNMPYAIQVGREGSLASFKDLREKLVVMQHMPYTSYVRDVATNATQIRLLLGAFETKEDTATLLNTLRMEGLEARIVNR
ncbi:MAG: SPOR domain-containing protein [Proteobacteria bacterium]|nr:SPOR domain-containing protein [Pseudomonadota bacterium]